MRDGGSTSVLISILAAAIALLSPPSNGLGDEQAASTDLSSLVGLLELVIEADADSARQCLQTLGAKIRSGEADAATLAELKKRLAPPLAKILAGKADDPLAADAALVAALWKEPRALKRVRSLASASDVSADQRKLALETLIFADDDATLKIVRSLLAARHESAAEHHRAALAALSREDEPEAAAVVLSAYPTLSAENQPLAIDLLTQRAGWSKLLVAEVAAGRLQPSVLNVNQVRKLLSLEDAELSAAVAKHWGTIRTSRDPARESLVAE